MGGFDSFERGYDVILESFDPESHSDPHRILYISCDLGRLTLGSSCSYACTGSQGFPCVSTRASVGDPSSLTAAC